MIVDQINKLARHTDKRNTGRSRHFKVGMCIADIDRLVGTDRKIVEAQVRAVPVQASVR